MHRLYLATVSQIADRYTVLINEVNRHSPVYPDTLRRDILHFIDEIVRVLALTPAEQGLIFTARAMVRQGDVKFAMFKLHEILRARMA